MTLPVADVNRVAEVLAMQAAVADDPAGYLRDVVHRADLPQSWRLQVLGKRFGDLASGARELVRWADARGVNPSDIRFTTLGSLVTPVLDDVGPDIAGDLVAVIVARRLFQDESLLADVRAKYLVPTALRPLAPAFQVPSLDLANEEFELQAIRAKEPELLDVGFLAAAIRQSASVCRIETLTGEAFGTGFLVAPKFALTCQHVVERAGTAELQLRFRCTSEARGLVVELDHTRPVEQCSSVTELDFALLRLAHQPDMKRGVRTIDLRSIPYPKPGDALSILQHPDGGPMKLAITANGVVRINSERSIVRYQAATSGGSSGAPCFDEQWRIVAIHHAERATLLGAVREGVLMEDIRTRIADIL